MNGNIITIFLENELQAIKQQVKQSRQHQNLKKRPKVSIH